MYCVLLRVAEVVGECDGGSCASSLGCALVGSRWLRGSVLLAAYGYLLLAVAVTRHGI